MSDSFHIFLSTMLLVALCYAMPAASAEKAGRPPNVLFVVVDTLRADHTGFHGYHRNTTPNVDRLAAEAVVFRNAMAVTSWTTPSVAALLTSRYPSEVSPQYPPVVLPPHVLRLPQLFQAGGYSTAAIVSHFLVGRDLKFDVGFDAFDEEEARGHSYVSSPGVTDRAIAFLNQHRDTPFFLFVHYFDPHYDFQAHEGYDFAAADYEGPVQPDMPWAELEAIVSDLSATDVEHVLALYDSEVAFTDFHIGRLLDRLRELGLFDRTLIVFTADHGEEFKERGLVGHGNHLHRESIHVPLLFKPPGRRDGKVVDSVVSLIDVPSTICALTGVPWPKEHPSRGVPLELDSPEPAQGRRVFAELLDQASIVIDGRWKFFTKDMLRGARLFDLEQDPGELTNAFKGRRKIARRLRQQLDQFSETLRLEADDTLPELDDETRKELEALGYAQ